MLNENTPAPDFTLPDAAGTPHSLADFRGQWVVLYNAYGAFQAKNAAVIGISKDSAASHQKFAAKYELPFLLLSDPDHTVLELYDVWKEKKQYGKVSMGTVRSTYLIDPEGIIRKAMPKVKPDTNAADVLAILDALTARA